MPVLVVEDLESDFQHICELVIRAGYQCQRIAAAPLLQSLVRYEDFTHPTESPSHLPTNSLILIGTRSSLLPFAGYLAAIHAKYPGSPVVVLTDDTSTDENTGREGRISSREALQHPIAGCLPHCRIDLDLEWTLKQILGPDHASDSNSDGQGGDKPRRERLCYTFGNIPDLLALVVAQIRSRLEPWSVSDDMELVRVTVALSEALENAMYHGNLELSSDLRQGDGKAWRTESQRRRTTLPYCERQVRFQASIGPDTATFVIRDEGPGFDPASLQDCTKSHNLELCSGRGLLLMNMYMDGVDYNETGNEITLTKHRPQQLTEAT